MIATGTMVGALYGIATGTMVGDLSFYQPSTARAACRLSSSMGEMILRAVLHLLYVLLLAS